MKENLSGTNNMDIHSLMEVEELHDKELEEAQEHRRTCEIEERNALKAYRKAQRATMEANSRCSYLYRKRELYSANFRSLMMDNPSMFWSSRLHDHFGPVPNSSNNICEVDMHVRTLNHQMESDLYAHNQCIPANVSPQHVCHHHEDEEPHEDEDQHDVEDQHEEENHHEDEQGLASNPCSEPDGSTSDPQKNENAEANTEANVARSQSNNLNMSVDEGDENFPNDDGAAEGNLVHQKKEEKYNEKETHVYDDLRTLDSSQDSLLLEASLRSQLFARLGIKTPLNDSRSDQSLRPATDSSAQDDGSGKVKTGVLDLILSEAEKDQSFDFGGTFSLRVLPVYLIDIYIHLMPISRICSSS